MNEWMEGVVILVILLIFKWKILNFKKFSIIDIYKDRCSIYFFLWRGSFFGLKLWLEKFVVGRLFSLK